MIKICKLCLPIVYSLDAFSNLCIALLLMQVCPVTRTMTLIFEIKDQSGTVVSCCRSLCYELCVYCEPIVLANVSKETDVGLLNPKKIFFVPATVRPKFIVQALGVAGLPIICLDLPILAVENVVLSPFLKTKGIIKVD